jgi:hypothetical protein
MQEWDWMRMPYGITYIRGFGIRREWIRFFPVTFDGSEWKALVKPKIAQPSGRKGWLAGGERAAAVGTNSACF